MNDSTDLAVLAARGGRGDIVRTIARHFRQEPVGDTPERALERAEAMVAYYDKWHRAAHAHELAEKLRHAIDGLELDDHWATMYQAHLVDALPDLIDPPQDAAPDFNGQTVTNIEPPDNAMIYVLNAAGEICIAEPAPSRAAPLPAILEEARVKHADTYVGVVGHAGTCWRCRWWRRCPEGQRLGNAVEEAVAQARAAWESIQDGASVLIDPKVQPDLSGHDVRCHRCGELLGQFVKTEAEGATLWRGHACAVKR